MPSIKIAANYIFGTEILSDDFNRSGHLQIVYDNDDPSTLLVEAEVQSPYWGPLGLLGNWDFQLFGQAHGDPTPYIADDDTIENTDRYVRTDAVRLESYQTAENVWNMLEKIDNVLRAAVPGLDYDAKQNSNSYVNTVLYTVGIDLGKYLDSNFFTDGRDINNLPGSRTNVLLGSEQGSLSNVPINMNLTGENSGTDGDDFIRTGIGRDAVEGGGGNDTIMTSVGNDSIYGGQGNNTLIGGIGDDSYHITWSGDSSDTIIDEDGQGAIYLNNDTSSSLLIGLATPDWGSSDATRFYEINGAKLEYDLVSKDLNIYSWGGNSTGNITIKNFDSGDLRIHLTEEIITIPVPDPTPAPEPELEPITPAPDTDGSPDTLLSVQAVNKTIDVGTRIPLLDLFPFNGWVDNDGVNDITSFAVADRTPGGGYLEASGVQVAAGEVYEFPVTDIINWWFVAGPNAAEDEIGFNIIQANGDYSPRLEPGAIVTTIVPTTPPPPSDDPFADPAPTGGGTSNLAALSLSSISTGASSGGKVDITYVVKNIGDVTSAKGKADIVLAATADLLNGQIGDTFNIPELNPGEQRTYIRTVDVPNATNGNYFLGVDVRSVSLGHNLIESDDTASIPFQIAAGLSGDPDLRPIFSDPEKIFESNGIAKTIDFSISTNTNGSPSYDYGVFLSRDSQISSDDIALIDKTSTSGLGSSGTHNYTDTQILIPSSVPDGLYYLIVTADQHSKIIETNEINNTASNLVPIVSRGTDSNDLSNIVGSHIEIPTDVMEVQKSYNISAYGFLDSIDDAIQFPGNSSILPVEVKLYLSEDNIFDKSDIPFDKRLEAIQKPIGDILDESFTLPIPQWVDSGDYYLFAAFDPGNKIAEDSESDNVTSGTNVTIVNNVIRTVTAGDDTIELFEGNTYTVDILANDTTSISQGMTVLRFEGDFVDSSAPFVGQTQSGLGYSIARDGTLNLDAAALNIDLQPGEVRTETFRYELRGLSDKTSDLGVVTVSIRDPESDTIQITPNDATVKEADGQIEFTITRSGDRLNTAETLYVSTTEDHGSTNNDDYTSLQKQSLTFGVGEVSKVVPVNILSDSVAEFDETFGLIVQTTPTDPTSTFFTSTTFTIQEDMVVPSVSSNTKLYPGHTLGEFSNLSAFAALKDDGSVVTWGDPAFGGDSSRVSSDLDGTIDVKQIYSNEGAFAALRADGSVITWGSASHGGFQSAFNAPQNVTQIFSTKTAFAALHTDGSITTWGDSNGGADSSAVFGALHGAVDVTEVYSNKSAFAALRADGSVITWGDPAFGGDSSRVASDLDGTIDVTKIFSNEGAFAALRADGSVITWGSSEHGGITISGASFLQDVTQIYSTTHAFAALHTDGSVDPWGNVNFGADVNAVFGALHGAVDVTEVFSNNSAFVALLADGSVVTWGDPNAGGSVPFGLSSALTGVTRIFSTTNAFAALKDNGSVVTWGDPASGGDSLRVTSDLDGAIDVTQIFSNEGAFAALRADGSVITWGSASHGGFQSAFNAPQNVTQIYSTTNSFTALHTDGSITTWGDVNGGGDSSGVHSQLRSGVIDLANIYTDNNAVTNISGDSIVVVDGSTETVVLEDGNKLVGGIPDEINGVKIENFGVDDLLFINGVELQQSDLTATKGSAILSLDTNNDDLSDTVITLEGDYRLESFVVVGASSSGSYIKYLGNAVPVGANDNITTTPTGFETDEDTAFTTVNVLANDTDSDGDALSVTTFNTTNTLGQVTNNGDGTFNYDPNGAFKNLNFGETATDSFVYTVSDGNGGNDTATVTITINGVDEEPILNPITGTPGRDILTGTPADDIISSLGGSIDRMSGGAGADIFAFGVETRNGIRERDIITDYENIDAILAENGAAVASIRPTSSGVAIFFEGDGDAVYVQGEAALVGNITILPEDILL